MAIDLRKYLFSNFSRSTLAAGLSVSDTEISLQEGDGALFPEPDNTRTPASIFSAIISDSTGEWEIVYCTFRDGDTLTVERGKEGTTAKAWEVGDTIIHSVTKGFVEQRRESAVAPSTPTLTAVNEYGDAELDWSASTPATGDTILEYEVYRVIDPATEFTLIATVDGATLSYTDDTVTLDGTVHRYKVRAKGQLGGFSALSDEAVLGNLGFIPFLEPNSDGETDYEEEVTPSVPSDHYSLDTSPNDCDVKFIPRDFNVQASVTYPLPLKRLSGKVYAEFEIDEITTRPNDGFHEDVWFGRIESANNTGQFSHFRGTDALIGYRSYDGSGALIHDGTGSTQSAGSSGVVGDVISFAIDFDNEKAWMAVNGVWVGSGTQDPASGVGGFWWTDRDPTLTGATTFEEYVGFVCGGDEISGTNGSMKCRFSEEFWTYTPPSGFEDAYEKAAAEDGVPSTGSGFADPVGTWHITDNRPAVAYGLPNSSSSDDQLIHEFARSDGKWYAELTGLWNNVFSSSTIRQWIGITSKDTNDFSVAPYATGNIGVCITNDEGFVRGHSSSIGFEKPAEYPNDYLTGTENIDTRTSDSTIGGDVFMIAVDLDNGRVYFGMNGIWFEGYDPTNSSDGMPIPDFGVESGWYLSFNNNLRGMLANAGGVNFAFDIPSGYNAWGADTGTYTVYT